MDKVTNFDLLLSQLDEAKHEAIAHIKELEQYIKDISSLITVSTDPDQSHRICPFCDKGSMKNITTLFNSNISIRHRYGSYSLTDYLSQGEMASLPLIGEECQECGIFQTSLSDVKIRNRWDAISPGGHNSLSSLVLSNFKIVQAVYMVYKGHSHCFVFELSENLLLTFGLLTKDAIITRLGIQKTTNQKKRSYRPKKVYLMIRNTGDYKIGVSSNPKARLANFKTVDPGIKLLHSFIADNPIIAEEVLHHIFREKNVGGEWFRLSKNDIADIQSVIEYKDGKFIKPE